MTMPSTSSTNSLFVKGNIGLSSITSVGFTLATRAVLGSLSTIGSPAVRSVSDLKSNDVYNAVATRRLFRETWLASTAVCVWNLVETIAYTIIGALALVFKEKQFINLAQRSFVQLITNIAASVVGLVGQFSPTYAGKLYVLALKNLYKLDPKVLALTAEEFGKEFNTALPGLIKICSTRQEEELVNNVFTGVGSAVGQVRTQIDAAFARLVPPAVV